MNLCLNIMGAKWVSYPERIKFPAHFSKIYPFRGRGIVAKVLYYLHTTGMDRFILDRDFAPLPFDEVAWFWPSPSRSIDRFYGYKIADGTVVGYLKVARGKSAITRLEAEVENVNHLLSHIPKTFKTPACLRCQKLGDCVVAEFEPLPSNTYDIPDIPESLEKVRIAREEIASLGFAHGDFMPHNMKFANDVLWIIDWEELTYNTSGVLDEISFDTAFRFFVRKESMHEVSMYVKKKYLSGDMVLRSDAIEALRSMAVRKVGLGERILETLNLQG